MDNDKDKDEKYGLGVRRKSGKKDLKYETSSLFRV